MELVDQTSVNADKGMSELENSIRCTLKIGEPKEYRRNQMVTDTPKKTKKWNKKGIFSTMTHLYHSIDR